MAGIVLVNEREIERRVGINKDYLESDAVDPITFVTRQLEKIADETGVVSSVMVSEHGKLAIKFTAALDVKKLRAMRLARPRGE